MNKTSFSMVNDVQISKIFPPKDLEKIRAPKIRMRRFFFLKNFQSYFLVSTYVVFNS